MANLTYQLRTGVSSMMESGFSSIFRNFFAALRARAPIIRNPWNFWERFLRASSQNPNMGSSFCVKEMGSVLFICTMGGSFGAKQNLNMYNGFCFEGLAIGL